jgi:hypothetical protein
LVTLVTAEGHQSQRAVRRQAFRQADGRVVQGLGAVRWQLPHHTGFCGVPDCKPDTRASSSYPSQGGHGGAVHGVLRLSHSQVRSGKYDTNNNTRKKYAEYSFQTKTVSRPGKTDKFLISHFHQHFCYFKVFLYPTHPQKSQFNVFLADSSTLRLLHLQ